MKQIILVVVLTCVSEMFAAECFYGKDWETLKEICSECTDPRIDPKTMTDTQAVKIIREDLLPYIKKLKHMQKNNTNLQLKYKQKEKELINIKKDKDVFSYVVYSAFFIGILLIICLIYWAVRTTKKNCNITVNNDALHCPRCGWEHQADETVCKNCKTHF